MGINLKAIVSSVEKCKLANGVKSILQTKPAKLDNINLSELKPLSKDTFATVIEKNKRPIAESIIPGSYRWIQCKMLKQYRKLAIKAGFDSRTRPEIGFFNDISANNGGFYQSQKGKVMINLAQQGIFSNSKKMLRHELKHAEQEKFILKYLGLEKFKLFCAKESGISEKALSENPDLLGKNLFNTEYFQRISTEMEPLSSAKEIKRAKKLIKATEEYPSFDEVDNAKKFIKFLYKYYSNKLEREAITAGYGF